MTHVLKMDHICVSYCHLIRLQISRTAAKISYEGDTRTAGNRRGFSMGIFMGRLSYGGQEIPLYGLAELFIMKRNVFLESFQ
jgi:hypothetical protein